MPDQNDELKRVAKKLEKDSSTRTASTTIKKPLNQPKSQLKKTVKDKLELSGPKTATVSTPRPRLEKAAKDRHVVEEPSLSVSILPDAPITLIIWP